jgi:hypothetical protein
MELKARTAAGNRNIFIKSLPLALSLEPVFFPKSISAHDLQVSAIDLIGGSTQS